MYIQDGYTSLYTCVCALPALCVCVKVGSAEWGGGESQYSWSIDPVKDVNELYSFAV